MERLEITGGHPLRGSVQISGAKNEALKAIPLAVLIQNEFILENVPRIADIEKQLEIFEFLGGKYQFEQNRLTIDGSSISKSSLESETAKKLRSSVVYIGPLLARFGAVDIPFPGGCAIGRRPIDTHLNAFEALGAEIKKTGDNYNLRFDTFKSKEVKLDEPSVTATENVVLFLSNFEDNFKIENCALEPEITALCDILNDAGAKITISDRTISIRGNKNLSLQRAVMIPDRIEAFSYLIGFLVTGGEGKITNFPAEYMSLPLEILKNCGADFTVTDGVCEVRKSTQFKPFEVATAPYPEFPTDMQSPLSLIAALSNGTSKIHETMFENRLAYLEELKKMGLRAKILNKHEAEIEGPANLRGATIQALDLRSGITLVLAALAADGKSIIENGEIIDRGYENLTTKLASLGAEINSL